MIVYSDVTGKSYDVKTYTSAYGSERIDHSSFLDILENQLEPGTVYDVEVCSAGKDYCAVKCTIEDANGRKVEGFSDVNTDILEGRELADFAKEHPLLTAVNSAEDMAVRAYLRLPKTLNEETEKKEAPEDKKEEAFPMNPPEPEPLSDEEKQELEDLSKELPPINTKYYGKRLTLSEIYEKDPSWMNYTKNTKSEKYNNVRRFLELKKRSEQSQ